MKEDETRDTQDEGVVVVEVPLILSRISPDPHHWYHYFRIRWYFPNKITLKSRNEAFGVFEDVELRLLYDSNLDPLIYH